MKPQRRAPVIAGAVIIVVAALLLAAVTDRSAPPRVVVAGFGRGPVHPGEPRTDTWRAVADVRPVRSGDSSNACERGEPSCLDAVVAEMEVRLEALGCRHTAPFAFTYLEMTRGVQRRLADPGFFNSPPATSHFDARFAVVYFDAFDNWAAGRIDDVPGAWRVAFAAAEDGRTGAATDLLLGMNAHIARDLSYVVAEAVLADPTLVDHLEDFQKINDVIAEVKDPMLVGVAARFVPDLTKVELPISALAASDGVELIGAWRNQAFERGVQMARATTDSERDALAATIDREAVATAVLLLNAGTASGAQTSPAERDTHCKSRRAG